MSSSSAGNVAEAAVVIVTGGGQGIGRDFALRFAAEGYAVVVADLRQESATRVAEECAALGRPALGVACDVSDEDSVAALVAEVRDRFGRIDVLINNAAIFSTLTMKKFEEIPKSEWDTVMAVNVTGAFLCARAVAPLMRAAQFGRIINISSATVLFGRPNYLHYVASKSAVIGLTRGLATELGPDGITVNSILPGSVATEVKRDSVTPEQAQAIVARQAVGRRLTPSDIVGTAVFLASADAGAMSGQSVVVDGGANFL